MGFLRRVKLCSGLRCVVSSVFCFLFFESNLLSQPSGNEWFLGTNTDQYVDIGEVDIAGTKLTVEAIVYHTTTPEYQDIVSKHRRFTDINYLLRTRRSELTTSDGYYSTPLCTSVETNKFYHVAMTYDGTRLSHYINGKLVGFVPATGNMYLNDWTTKIGYVACLCSATPIVEQFMGYINEVRIWNVVRTKAEINANMWSSLASPATQTGLQAYYKFNSLINLVNNGNNNGSLISATISNPKPAGAIGSSCVDVLPVDIISFKGWKYAGSVELNWRSAEKGDFGGYVVEKSEEGNQRWDSLAFIPGRRASSYSYSTIPSGSDGDYYRLKLKEKDETFKYSAVIYVKGNSGVDNSVVFIPENNQIMINVGADQQGYNEVSVYDVAGKQCRHVILAENSVIDISDLNNGVYFISGVVGNNRVAQKILKTN